MCDGINKIFIMNDLYYVKRIWYYVFELIIGNIRIDLSSFKLCFLKIFGLIISFYLCNDNRIVEEICIYVRNNI